MKSIIFFGIGAGLGSAIYQAFVHGISETDWYRAVIVALFTMLFYGLYAGFKRWASKED
ncbi:hypothetical protein ABC502_09940 [Alkalimonas sp. NCh-2]|uniref:hypothetical protein n=1 Tax=Alkalimonas sp. NCh-2 TaxID=3144846 RepID=UPI0031F70B9B